MLEFKEQDWGVRLNEKNYCKFDLDAPDWAKDLPTLSWYSEGLVVWDEIQKNAVNLNYWYTMVLLDKLQEDQNWKTQGHDVFEQYIQIEIDVKRKKRKQPDTQENQPGSKNETVTIELHLPPDRVDKLLVFLNKNERLIRSEGQRIKYRHDQGVKAIADMLYESFLEL